MKKIKKTQAKGFYIFRGEVAANSNFIETLDEAKQFLIYANFFLKDYMTIYEYLVTRHEWQMIVKLKPSIKISGSSEDVAESGMAEQPVWRVVSERMRLFLSCYVKRVNKMRGRTGTLVHSSYERYYFETLGEATRVIEEMRQQTFRFYRRKKKYRGSKKHYMISKKLGNGSIFLCSKEILTSREKLWGDQERQEVSDLQEFVLLKMVNSTKFLHNHNKPHIFNPKRE